MNTDTGHRRHNGHCPGIVGALTESVAAVVMLAGFAAGYAIGYAVPGGIIGIVAGVLAARWVYRRIHKHRG